MVKSLKGRSRSRTIEVGAYKRGGKLVNRKGYIRETSNALHLIKGANRGALRHHLDDEAEAIARRKRIEEEDRRRKAIVLPPRKKKK